MSRGKVLAYEFQFNGLRWAPRESCIYSDIAGHLRASQVADRVECGIKLHISWQINLRLDLELVLRGAAPERLGG